MNRSQAASPLIALLGKRDVPTDGVEDYCRYLTSAMNGRGYRTEVVRVPWDESGWIRAGARLWGESGKWKGVPVLVQYTALMWSQRGLPLLFMGVLLVLKVRGARVITIFHDVTPFRGKRRVDRFRRAVQRWVVRRAYSWTEASVLPVPIDEVGWLPHQAKRANFIPNGPNVPVLPAEQTEVRKASGTGTIAVFVVTDGGDIREEVAAIAETATAAAQQIRSVRLVTLGRGSRESEGDFRRALAACPVEFEALGILPAEEVARVLSRCDVSLFVRGPVTTQRGSAIASIACLLPLVGYADTRLPTPLAEAGVVGVPVGDRKALAENVVRVLTNPQLQGELRERSRRAYEKYFSWDAVAAQFAELLDRG